MEKNLLKHQDQLKLTAKSGDRVDLVLHVHDELVYEIPIGQTRNLAKILKSSMEKCIRLSIPLRVKIKTGRSWGELSELVV